ncbi:MAG: M67 family metallopeptidase [Dehalococcoidia bacterium]|nr:M67 family metallopeptidase [Dehalococcoidia bacterium]
MVSNSEETMLRIPKKIIDEMISHAIDDLPNEACGQVNGKNNKPLTVNRVKNVAASPYRYSMDPLTMLKLEQAREKTGEDLFAIYHSHVASEAYPSPTDIRQAFFPPGQFDREPMFPECFYILVSLAQDRPEVRAFKIRQGGLVEEELISSADD